MKPERGQITKVRHDRLLKALVHDAYKGALEFHYNREQDLLSVHRTR